MKENIHVPLIGGPHDGDIIVTASDTLTYSTAPGHYYVLVTWTCSCCGEVFHRFLYMRADTQDEAVDKAMVHYNIKPRAESA